MKRNKKLMIILSVVLLLISIISVIFNVYSNIILKKSFKSREDSYPYEQAAKNLHIDLNKISMMFPKASAPIGYDYKEEIISPISISYYKSKDDSTPIYTIEKGDIIHFKTTGFTSSEITYRGVESLPTNIQGWRLVKPFEVEGKKANDNLLYVKLSDLKKVSKTWLDENPKVMTSMSSHMQGLFPTKQEYVNLIIFRIDRILYEEGVYLSPDLYKPILSVLTYVTFTLAFVISMLYLFVDKFYVKK